MGAAAELVAEAAVIEHRRGFSRRWYRTPSFVAGVAILGTIVLAAICAPLITTHDPIQQDLLNTLADEGESGVRRAYPAAKLARLAALKRRYDPDNVYHLNQNIRPEQ